MKNTVKINSVDLINADCLHFIQSLPDDSIDLIVTDPPYFKVKPNGWDNQWKGDEDYIKWLDHCLAQFWRVLKPSGSLYLFCGHRLASDIEIMMRERFNVLNHIIWRVRQLLTRHSRNSFTNCLLQNRNTRQPEVKKHSRRLSIPTGDYLIFPAPAWSNEKVNCLSSGQSQFLPAVCQMALIFLWRQWMCRRDVIAVLWFR